MRGILKKGGYMNNKDYLLKHVDDLVHDAMMQIAWKKYKKAEEICSKAIDTFYQEYSPKVYDRQYDLKNVYNLDVTRDGEFIFEFGSEFMEKKHRVDNEYIYQKMFKEGWHGGAHDGAYHPSPGKNYWRTPSVSDPEHGIAAYSYWWNKPAARSTSPYENIIRRWNLWMSNEGKKMELDVWGKTVKKYIRR